MAQSSSSRTLSFSVDRLLQQKKPVGQQSKRKESSSSSGGSSSSTPPSSPPAAVTAGGRLLFAQPRGIMINAGITTFPFSLGLPLNSPPGTTTAAVPPAAWNPSAAAFNTWSVLPGGGAKIAAAPWSFHPSVLPQLKRDHPHLNTKRIVEISSSRSKNIDDLDDAGDEDSDSSSPEPGSSDMLGGGEDGNQIRKYKKKKRTTFTSSQLQQLETRFNQQKYLTKLDRCRMAQSLGLTEKHIKTWYQNRRTKWKRECTDEIWSRERENAAASMYTQHLQLKSMNSSSSPLSIT